MKPILYLDVDGVLANLVGEFIYYLNRGDMGVYTESDFTSWNISEALETVEDEEFVNRLFMEKGFCRDVRPYPQARLFVDILNYYYDVRIATAPYNKSIFWVAERTEWLEEIMGVASEKIIFAHDKSVLNGDVIIEDNSQNAILWANQNKNGIAILIDRPWNQSLLKHKRVKRVKDYTEALRVLETHRKQSRVEHREISSV